MIAFPGMLTGAAEAAGIKVPDDPDKYQEVKDTYPHFFVFCMIQLARRMAMNGEHFRNAEVIAKIPAEKLITMTIQDLIEAGLEYPI